MPRTGEKAFNYPLAEVLRGKHPRWRVEAERSAVLQDGAGLTPDIVIRHPGGAPVIVETEWEPAATVEEDARARLGATVGADGQRVEQAVAVAVPEGLRTDDQARLAGLIAAAKFRYCVLAHREGEPAAPERWPRSGWIEGGIDDLAGLIEQTALSERRIEEGMRILEDGVRQAAAALRASLERDHPAALERIAEALRQEDGEQTSRMAMAIVANALTFHTAIAGGRGSADALGDTPLDRPYVVPTLDELREGAGGRLRKRDMLDVWRHILNEINYWPIFDIARQVLLPLRDSAAHAALDRLSLVAAELDGIGVTSTQDLAGQMFGRLIADRKFLATFYTRPSSAALLAELAASRLDADWADPEAIKRLRVADLACGTGALLSAAYRAIAARHRRAGGDDERLHRAMMEEALIGADIMPAATHLTASMLSGAHPAVTFGNTRIHTMPYGRQEEATGRPAAIGSLDLIASDAQPSLFGTGEHVLTGTGEALEVGDHRQNGDEIRLPHGSADLVIMNPPFTRPTGQEAEKVGVPVPSFAGFARSEDEQHAMSAALRDIRDQLARRENGLALVASHGNAGLASNFIDLAHAKLRPGGVLALVLPLAIVQGGAWAGARALLAAHYDAITIVTIATTGQSARSFSADTGFGEALVVARRRGDRIEDADEAVADTLYVNLLRRPPSTVEASEIAVRVGALAPDERGGAITAGDDELGFFVRATLADGGCASLREIDVARAALALQGGTLRLPRMAGSVPLHLTTLGELGSRGLHRSDLVGRETGPDGLPRGPFDVAPPSIAPSFPMLWAHDADRERRLIVAPDRQGRVRPGCDERAVAVWNRASRLHVNVDFRLNSQSLAACLTPERSIGGRAWPNFGVEGDPRREEAVTLWANTTLGLLAFWWHGIRQQQGRATVSVSRHPELPALDVRALSEAQLGDAAAIFEAFADREFLPANEAYHDPTRQALDRAVLVELLGLPEAVLEPLEALRRQWCAEPTVHGGKSTRPS